MVSMMLTNEEEKQGAGGGRMGLNRQQQEAGLMASWLPITWTHVHAFPLCMAIRERSSQAMCGEGLHIPWLAAERSSSESNVC